MRDAKSYREASESSYWRLGYKAHVAADSGSELPVAFIVASANENEKRHAYKLLDKALKATRGRVKKLVADSQYSSKRFRKKAADCKVDTVIPYPANQHPKQKGLLRVDKHFKTYGPLALELIRSIDLSACRFFSCMLVQLSPCLSFV